MSINSKYKVAKTLFLIVRAAIRNIVNYEYPKLAHQYFKDKTLSMQIRDILLQNCTLLFLSGTERDLLFHVSFFLW